ncbi:MAG: bifunctional aspartate kinase/homoserine dehydrogenase I [Treponema sp.]|nr:bifunctional aspartate kinase/homoserine dehydrogenase I [Treponema sp.]
MITLKFGGTSMGSAQRMFDSASIMVEKAKEGRISVVISAVAGISNMLQDSIDTAIAKENTEKYIEDIRSTHITICNDLEKMVKNFDKISVMTKVDAVLTSYENFLNAVSTFKECPVSIQCHIMGLGELMSTPIVEGLLTALGLIVELVDSRKVIFTTGNQAEGDVDYVRTVQAFRPYAEGSLAQDANVLLFPGFICTWQNNQASNEEILSMGLLGRNGSDFSAAIVAMGLNSKRVEFWTDVDGVYTADPRIVKDAILIDDMSYEEAMELSFFGSKVLHPKTLTPLATRNIEVWSLNSHNKNARGTRIAKGPFPTVGPVRGISCLKNTAMISVSGSGMRGKTGIAARIFRAVSSTGISMLLITQSSSEYTISFCVPQVSAHLVCNVLNNEFKLEIGEELINPIDMIENCAIVSIVGDGMHNTRGVAGTFLNSLASQDINILAIAQGSSERSISVVINGSDGDTAVRISHRFFFNTKQTIEVFVFGAGTIGGCLLDQIHDQQKDLFEKGIDIRVMAIANIDGMIMSKTGLDLSNWREDVEKNGKVTNLDEIFEFVEIAKPLNPIFVDCTASYDLPNRYIDILNAGMHITTPNKRANSMSMDFYKEIRKTATKMRRRFLYETNAGAGLPIIDTLQNLFKSGDKLTGFYGIMSGSLSYIFGRLDEGITFSRAVMEAREKRFTEPDPRDDLGGMDVARKALIIARESGMEVELEDIKINRIFPDDFDDSGTVDEFMKKLPLLDKYFAEKMDTLRQQDKVLRMAAKIENGKCSVGMIEVDSNNPLYTIRGGENAFVFHTARYSPIPMTIRGYGAGAGVTAAGVFGDILRTVSW